MGLLRPRGRSRVGDVGVRFFRNAIGVGVQIGRISFGIDRFVNVRYWGIREFEGYLSHGFGVFHVWAWWARG